MAATVFQVLGTVSIGLFLLLSIILLPLVSRLLKRINSALENRKIEMGGELRRSLTGIDTAREQVEGITAATLALKKTLEDALKVADAATAFLKSNAFQLGLPVLAWVLFFAIALPRGIVGKKKRRKIRPVPPPGTG